MADYKEIKVDIGAESAFTKLPAQVDIGDWSYFLAKSKKGVYQLLSNVCPARNGRGGGLGQHFHVPGPRLALREDGRDLPQRPQLPDDSVSRGGGRRPAGRICSG